MRVKNPFTKQEQKIMDHLIKAHNNFIKLKRAHNSEIDEWVISLHRLQDILGHRVLRRDYKEYFK